MHGRIVGDHQRQLGLFGAEDAATPGAGDPPRVAAAEISVRVAELAARVPERVRLGTSSWSFPGWRGHVWAGDHHDRALSQHGLPAYAAHPLLRTVGIDRTYHAPMAAPALGAYAAQVPEDFRFLAKAHMDCVMARFPHHPRHGDLRGRRNPRWLDPAYAAEAVVGPFVEGLGPKAGVLLFQFPPQGASAMGGPEGFTARLETFLRGLPRGPLYAFELRDPELLTARYARVLADHGAEHCVSVHPSMPPPAEQYARTGGRQRRALIVRWMLHRHHDYAGAFRRYAPFDRIVDDDPVTRRALVDLIVDAELRSLVIVNNKAEGSSPLSIVALAHALVDALGTA